MRNFHLRKNQHFKPAVNLDKLWTLVTEQTREKYKDHPEKKVPVIDVVRAVSSFLSYLPALTSTTLKFGLALCLLSNQDSVGSAREENEMNCFVPSSRTSFSMFVG